MDRKKIAEIIVDQLKTNKKNIELLVNNSINEVGYFYLDDLLPEDFVIKLFNVFPETKDMFLRKNIREYKYVGIQMNKYNSLIEETIYAFQDLRVVEYIAKIFNLKNIYPDPKLYAGGISVMKENNFLNPHIDNSHNEGRKKWRVLNLLYYVTPDWKEEYGGNLEIWNKGMNSKQITIESKFNRLVVMLTHNHSWHSVSPVNHIVNRCCISNYYFSDFSTNSNANFHVTSFRARPGNKLKDLVLRFDTYLRMIIRNFFKHGIKKEFHIYKDNKKF